MINSRLKAIALVAGREIRERTRSRAFRISTFLLLMIVVAAVVFPAIAAQTRGVTTYTVGFIKPVSNELTVAVKDLGPTIGGPITITTFDSRSSGVDVLRAGGIDVLVEPGVSIETKVQIDPNTPTATASLAYAISDVEQRYRGLEKAGLSSAQASAALNASPLPFVGLEKAAPRNSSDAEGSTTGMAMLFIFLTLYGAFILNGVIEEKGSRVIEILLSALRPSDLLAGKVIGIGIVGTMQGVVLVAATFLARAVSPGGAQSALTPAVVSYTLLWFLLGFAVYAGLFACAGALVSRAEDAQSLVFPIQLPLIASYVVGLTSALNGPNAVLNAMSYFPLTAPMTMLERMSAEQVKWWEVLISVGITVVFAYFVMRLAAAIFAGGILRSGQRVKLREAWRTK